jgi:PAS domain S-box-containing protein
MTFNHGFRDYFLRDRGMAVALGQCPEDLFPTEEFVRIWRAYYARALHAGPYSTEYAVYAGTRTLELSFNLMMRSGRAFGISVFGRDISERKAAEEALRKSEQNFRQITEESPVAIYIIQGGKLVYVNPSLAKQSGYSRDEIVGKLAPQDLIHRHDVARLMTTLGERAAGRIQGEGVEYRGIRKDGSIVHVEAYGMLMEYQGKPAVMGTLVDISERKRAEAARRESENRYRVLFDNSRDAMMVLAPPVWNFVSANPATLELFGVKDEATFLSLGPWDVSPACQPDGSPSAEKALEMIKIAMLEGAHAFEWRHQRLDGRAIPASVQLTRLEFAGQSLLQATIHDLSPTERALPALRDSEEQLEKIFNHSSNAMALTELTDGKILNVNETWVRQSGISSSDAIGKTAAELGLWIRWDDCDECYQVLERDGRLRECETKLVLKGEERHFALNAEFLELRRGRFLLWEFHDITERKHAQEEIALLKHSIDVHYDAAYWTDSDGRFIYVNDAGGKALGFGPGELIGKTLLDVNENATAERMTCVWETLRAKGFHRSESIHRRKDGSEFPVEILTSHVRFGGKEYACGFARDMTEHKRADAERAKLTDQLQQAQKMESVGRQAGGVAHDFNNMLGVILGHAELALERVDSTGPLHNDLINIQSAAQRSADLTRQLLAFARKQTVAPKALNLNDAVAGMLKMARRLIGEDIQLDWRPGEKLWPVHVDPTQIYQILANLCVNARDAIANVGKITIETGNKVIDVELAAATVGMVPGDYVWLAVGDDGCGMDPATLSRAFEPFFTTKEVGKGTGLGLATVYGIVKQNNGFIDAHSELGKGTVFAIYLPRHVGKAVTARLDGATERVEPGRETILLVEDEAPLLAITRRMLERSGYKVLTASTPGQAMQLAREHAGTIDLLITDVVMPEMNGRDLAKNILPLYPQTKRLFMSGYTADVIAHQGVLDKGVFFIQKPFSAQDLAATVRKVLES